MFWLDFVRRICKSALAGREGIGVTESNDDRKRGNERWKDDDDDDDDDKNQREREDSLKNKEDEEKEEEEHTRGRLRSGGDR